MRARTEESVRNGVQKFREEDTGCVDCNEYRSGSFVKLDESNLGVA